METRALAIAFFYAVGTGLGGIIGPLLFGHLIATHNRNMVMVAFLIGAGVMALGGVAEIFLGVRAESTQLEDIAEPLTAEAAEGGYGDDGKSGGEQPVNGGQSATLEGPGRETARVDPQPQTPIPTWAGRRPVLAGHVGNGCPKSLLTVRRSRPRSRHDRCDASKNRVPLERADLARRIGARRWGPGRFREALDEAQAEGRVVRLGRGRYGSTVNGAVERSSGLSPVISAP